MIFEMDCKNFKEKFSDKFLNAVELEKEADTAQTAELLCSLPPKKLALNGVAILNLISSNLRTGLGGKNLLELAVDPSVSADDIIRNGELRVGDIVRIDKLSKTVVNKKAIANSSKRSNNTKSDLPETLNDNAAEGVITRISLKSLLVSIEDKFEEKLINLINERLWIVKISNSVTYKRMESTMRKLKEIESPNYLIQLLLGDVKYSPPDEKDLKSISKSQFYNDQLNQSQMDAINFAMSSPISIIHGPPGTGKTYTLIEAIRQLVVRKNERVLVCGPSNISVDTILERLNGNIPENKIIRIGHPARLLQTNLQHSLDILSKSSDNGLILKDIRSDIDKTLTKVKKCKKYSERRQLWADLKDFKRDLRVREKKVLHELILDAKVVVSTLHGAGSRELTSLVNDGVISEDRPLFDTIIIDEVSQSLEPQCWIPVIAHLGAKRLILAGDNKQLPPTIKSQNLKIQNQLGRTIFDRLVSKHGDSFKRLLNVQYRMNERIMGFSSLKLYNNELRADESVATHKLNDLDDVDNNDDTNVEVIWYDTQGGDYPEKSSDDDDNGYDSANTGSKYNEMESVLVLSHIKALIESNVLASEIGVISPYNAQVSLLKSQIHHVYPQIEVSSIDGFQGREKQVIILSLVRSNSEFKIGFLKDERRLNVAITRPKRQLCIIGDMETLGRSDSKFIKDWCQFAEDNYEIRYPDLTDY